MARVSVTESELAEAIRSALQVNADPNGAFTAREIAEALKCSLLSARGAISILSRQGRVVVVPRRSTRIDGQGGIVPAYRILKAAR